MLLGVPTDSVWSVGVDFHFEGDRVILDVAFVRVHQVSPGHVLGEAPVVLLAVEHVGNLPLELLPVPWTDEPELCGGVAGPGAGLGLSVTLQEEPHTLRIPVLKVLIVSGRFRGREGYWHYLCLGLSLHDHDLPRKVADNARLGEDRVSDLGEIINFELECGLAPGLVILFTDDIFISLDLRLSRVAGGVGLGLVHVLRVHHLLHGAQ